MCKNILQIIPIWKRILAYDSILGYIIARNNSKI